MSDRMQKIMNLSKMIVDNTYPIDEDVEVTDRMKINALIAIIELQFREIERLEKLITSGDKQ